MPSPLTRHEALDVLELRPPADLRAVKRAYRRLARQHHPDLGGDADTFQRLQQAYERLAGEPATALRTAVARGRPSRPPPAAAEGRRTPDLASVDWDLAVPDTEVRLDRHRTAVWLADDHTAAPVRPLTATSRAPGSRLNRIAPLLASDLTSRLSVQPGTDDRGRPVVALDVRGANRRARRALDRAALDGSWVRTRTSTTTVLAATLEPDADRRITALRATVELEALLAGLEWPLEAWTLHLQP